MNRRWLAGIFAFVFLAGIAGIYVFIPGNLVISRIERVNCNASAAFRTISVESNWGKWWSPAEKRDDSFRITGRFYHQTEISFIKGNLRIKSQLTVISSGGTDSTILQWQCSYPTSLNPLRRIAQYREAIRIKDHMSVTLTNLRAFLEKKENVYTIGIKVMMSTDSTLVATTLVTPSYPTTSEIYNRIGSIRGYIASQGAKEINYPMLHVKPRKDKYFETTIAIPTNRKVKESGPFLAQRYIPWKILVGEIKGGPFMAENALAQLQQYVADFQLSAMGVSFQSLVTERNQVADTTRWVTRVVQAVP